MAPFVRVPALSEEHVKRAVDAGAWGVLGPNVRTREVAIVDPHRVRFHLHRAWPDFMTLYGTLVNGAGWVVPKKYIERVGDDGFKKHKLAFSGGIASFFLDFLDQWDLAEAGYANGFDAGELHHTSGCGSRPSGNISGRAGWGRAWRSPR